MLGNISSDGTCYAVLPNNDTDGQCVCDRKGIVSNCVTVRQLLHEHTGVLCGECRNGMGVSALLNRCVDCGDINALLIVTLSKNVYCSWLCLQLGIITMIIMLCVPYSHC